MKDIMTLLAVRLVSSLDIKIGLGGEVNFVRPLDRIGELERFFIKVYYTIHSRAYLEQNMVSRVRARYSDCRKD